MTRPSNGAIFWFVAFIAVSALLVRDLMKEQPPPLQLIFPQKLFYEGEQLGGLIYIAGTLTGEGIAYKNNTTAVTCYRDRMECLTHSVQEIGLGMISRADMPMDYPVVKWDEFQVVAQGPLDVSGCRSATITIDRKGQTAAWVETETPGANCKYIDGAVYRYTIEDSPGWKAVFHRKK